MSGTLSHRRTGSRSVLPLVLLHALPLDSTMWDGVRAGLGGLDVITVDAPGFGDSPTGGQLAPGAEPSLATYANALKNTLDELGVGAIALAGLSIGGAVAAEFTVTHPGRVKGLAIIDSNISSDTDQARTNRARNAERAAAGDGYDTVRDWPTTMLGPVASDQVRADLDARLKTLPSQSLAWLQRAMAARPDRRDAVRQVDGPVYLIRGGDDPTCTAAMFDDLAARASRPTVVELQGVGHFSALEAPEGLAALLLQFHRAAAH